MSLDMRTYYRMHQLELRQELERAARERRALEAAGSRGRHHLAFRAGSLLVALGARLQRLAGGPSQAGPTIAPVGQERATPSQ